MGPTPQGNQVPPQVPTLANDQVPINPSAMTDDKVRSSMFQMAQGITTQSQAITAQDYREFVPRENQHTSNMARHARDFTRMNPPMFFR